MKFDENTKKIYYKIASLNSVGENIVLEAIEKGDPETVLYLTDAFKRCNRDTNLKRFINKAIGVNNVHLCGCLLDMASNEIRMEFFCDYISSVEDKSYHKVVFLMKKMEEYKIKLEKIFEVSLDSGNYALVDGCLHLDRELIKRTNGNYTEDVEKVISKWKTLVKLEL